MDKLQASTVRTFRKRERNNSAQRRTVSNIAFNATLPRIAQPFIQDDLKYLAMNKAIPSAFRSRLKRKGGFRKTQTFANTFLSLSKRCCHGLGKVSPGPFDEIHLPSTARVFPCNYLRKTFSIHLEKTSRLNTQLQLTGRQSNTISCTCRPTRLEFFNFLTIQ